jgi:hypothetical protein
MYKCVISKSGQSLYFKDGKRIAKSKIPSKQLPECLSKNKMERKLLKIEDLAFVTSFKYKISKKDKSDLKKFIDSLKNTLFANLSQFPYDKFDKKFPGDLERYIQASIIEYLSTNYYLEENKLYAGHDLEKFISTKSFKNLDILDTSPRDQILSSVDGFIYNFNRGFVESKNN